MKRVVFGIFAHPDDEAFLPSGTLIKYFDEGADLYLVCATRGEQGSNPDNVDDLGSIREKEWREAGKLIGVKKQLQLGYPDGKLSNDLFHEIAEKIEDFIINTLQSYENNTKITFITYDNCGVTGHLDHIAVSFITTYVYSKLKECSEIGSFEKLRYACLCDAGAPKNTLDFVFMPKGQTHDCIDETEDVSDVLDRKKQVMRAHHSQRKDAEEIIQKLGDNLAFEHFCLFKD